MDGDHRRMKQHDPSQGMSRRAHGSRSAADRFRQPGIQPGIQARGLSQDGAVAARPRPLTYMDYGYTDNSAFQAGSLQGGEMQPYPPQFSRPQQPLREHQRQQQFPPYESDMVYGLGQQGSAQAPYEVVSQYPSRQSAALEALSNGFTVPPYFPTAESTGTGVPAELSPYLTAAQLPSSAYNQPGPIGRSAQSFPATMADFTPVGTTGRLEHPPAPQVDQQQQSVASESSNLDAAYAPFQRALRATFDHTRAGRLVEASRSLLEISEWLVTNARELGILRDDQLVYSDRLQLWNDFNICWLAVCQKQKDLTLDMMRTGQQPPNTDPLSNDMMESMGRDLIQLCDKMEQHGLVDYQMGIWEEEILSVLGQCLDLIESRPDILRDHPITTATATATSRS